MTGLDYSLINNVLFITGYTVDVITQHGTLNSDICFISKPFFMNDLTSKVPAAL